MRHSKEEGAEMKLQASWLAVLLCFVVAGVSCQENAIKNISPSLIECYDGDTYEKWNLLPHSMETLIAIIRKIEDSPGLNMDLRQLSTAILHRFRQDGIVRNPRVKPQAGIMPYAPLGKQFFRHAQTLRVIPGNALTFPNNSISALERCTLHSMLSSSIDIFERGDESRVCKVANYAYRRYSRSAEIREKNVKEEVETLTAEQLEMMSKADIVDPNSLYPALPPNHPSSARLTDLPPASRCPTENGVVKTRWGTVSGGSVLAGIAAGLTPQQIRIGDLIRQTEQRVTSYSNDASVVNKFLGTLAGDLAEVALLQGPQLSGRYILGVDGNWNSSSQPLYYFLNSNENLEMTASEVRGDLDGLILANELPNYYPSKIGGLRLSQVLDMYYSNRGLFDRKNRACNRRAQLYDVAPTPLLTNQTHNAAIILSSGIAAATFSSEAIRKFATQAVNELGTLVPTMNSDTCDNRESSNSFADVSEPAVDLTIILDTSWPFENIKAIISQLLSGLSISKFNSNVTIINGQDGSIMINSTYDPNDFHYLFNLTNYRKLPVKGFELSRSLEKLRAYQTNKLNDEKRQGRAGGKSDVVLFVPYQTNAPQSDKEYCLSTIKTMQEEVPDAVILFLTYGSKDRWGEYVRESNDDLFSVSIGETTESYPAVDSLQTRIKQIPRRLVNTQCGADYESTDPRSSKALMETVVPGGSNFYRIHPNYFSSDDTENPPRVRIQASGIGSLRVCSSRELLHVNTSEAATSANCISLTSNSHIITMNCEDASYLHQCKPYYVSVSSNSTGPSTFACNDPKLCRYPDSVKYTISFENLVCKSGASTLFAVPLLLLLLLAQLML
ncbi:hypothetical protein TSAR_013207 [Trichomalopsis sarcophagae]|uniref:VWFA domain-containing protein n=1 Tax=Trichomalopsis sarcophagae TaxID=543379 RepID=A0A232EZ46_9HYME|nr:hypothetical protein TSAR_013207 [Trichomalopsis sarcophagae]